MKMVFFLISLIVLYNQLSATERKKTFWTEGDYTKEAVIKMPSFEKIISAIRPTVVTVTTLSEEKNPAELDLPPEETITFNNYLDKYLINQAQQSVVRQGSAFFINREGYLLTNFHVIDDGDQIRVQLDNGESFKADLIGADIVTDLALLKINKKIPEAGVVAFGNSDVLRVGQWVIAIGNPFGLSHSVTTGIISALGREINENQHEDFIQTDAALNIGNSGGPLFDSHGYIIGVNTATTASGTGIGFAIPINLVKFVVDHLRLYGRVLRGWTGIGCVSVSIQNSLSLKLKEKYAVKVVALAKDSPAEKAGIQKGDIILSAGGMPTLNQKDFTKIITSSKIGTDMMLSLFRKHKRMNVNVRISEAPEPDQKDNKKAIREESIPLHHQDFSSVPEIKSGEEKISFSEMTEELAEDNKIAFEKGLLILKIDADHPWANKIKKFDLVREISTPHLKEGKSTETKKDLAEILASLKKGDNFVLKIKRGDEIIFIPLTK